MSAQPELSQRPELHQNEADAHILLKKFSRKRMTQLMASHPLINGGRPRRLGQDTVKLAQVEGPEDIDARNEQVVPPDHALAVDHLLALGQNSEHDPRQQGVGTAPAFGPLHPQRHPLGAIVGDLMRSDFLISLYRELARTPQIQGREAVVRWV